MEETKTGEIDFIRNLSVLELSEMVKELEERFGVKVATAVSSSGSQKSNIEIDKIIQIINQLAQRKEKELRQDTESYLVAQSMGWNTDSIPLSRYIPVRIYLTEATNANEIYQCVKKFIKSIEFQISSEKDAEIGSWFKKLFAKSNEEITKEILLEALEKGKRALELKNIHKVQSEIDKNQAEAAAALITALKGEKEGVLQLGSILVVKASNIKNESQIFVRTLTQKEMIYLENNPEIIKNPAAILSQLDTESVKRLEAS